MFSKDRVSQNLNIHKDKNVPLIRFIKFGSNVYGVVAFLLQMLHACFNRCCTAPPSPKTAIGNPMRKNGRVSHAHCNLQNQNCDQKQTYIYPKTDILTFLNSFEPNKDTWKNYLITGVALYIYMFKWDYVVLLYRVLIIHCIKIFIIKAETSEKRIKLSSLRNT